MVYITSVLSCQFPVLSSQLVDIQFFDFVFQAQILPALQGNRDVAVLPQEIVGVAQAEGVTFLAPGIGEEFIDLQFADLVRDGLAGSGGKECGFTMSGL